MTTEYLFPQVYAHDSKAPESRRKTVIPTMGNHGRKVHSDAFVGGIKWLLDHEHWTPCQVAKYYNVSVDWVQAIDSGSTRLRTPAMPPIGGIPPKPVQKAKTEGRLYALIKGPR